MNNLITSTTEVEQDTMKGRFLTFLIGHETYGIGIRYVTEIIGIQDITEMPEMPNYIKGIINLRGKIIHLMDVRLRFKIEPRDYDDRTCVIIIDYNGTTLGLIVDSVSEVLTIPDEEIASLAVINANASNKYIKNIGKVENNVILLLDCEKLLSATDLSFMES